MSDVHDLVDRYAEPLVIGTDVAVLAPDGRLHGFLEKVPAA